MKSKVTFRPGFLALSLLLFAYSGGDVKTFALIMLSIAAHEIGHGLLGSMFEVQVKEIGFTFAGVYIRRELRRGLPGVLISLAGPLTTFALMLTLSGKATVFNFFLLVFSLLPFKGTDLWNAGSALRTRKAVAR